MLRSFSSRVPPLRPETHAGLEIQEEDFDPLTMEPPWNYPKKFYCGAGRLGTLVVLRTSGTCFMTDWTLQPRSDGLHFSLLRPLASGLNFGNFCPVDVKLN